MLCFLYFVVDERAIWSGEPFSVVGKNSILIYTLHEILEGKVPFCGGCGANSHQEYMRGNVVAILVWIGYAYYLHRRRTYIAL